MVDLLSLIWCDVCGKKILELTQEWHTHQPENIQLGEN